MHENLWAETRGAVQRLAADLAGRITNVMTNPAKACDLAIERSFAQRDWRKVVMYSINPTQFLSRGQRSSSQSREVCTAAPAEH